MGLFILFLLGIGNFAMHKAVLESRHPLLGQMPWFVHLLGGRFGLIVEFLLLTAAMLLSHNAATPQGASGVQLAYICYTAANALAAWLIITRRV
ncbi:hypothetical protein [Croceicoccus mobilis]|uniref:Uncharacterized protein n=1 Tax=Croceicoccus mobilis TaxID=1703339 RepID=A0A917DQ60_9SPHN|nr:hypothetical protein [Croceicoccus mobilis]GGD60322.1 hypothetical protein GCM10010990_07170 [Croceicoccus mobilis]